MRVWEEGWVGDDLGIIELIVVGKVSSSEEKN